MRVGHRETTQQCKMDPGGPVVSAARRRNSLGGTNGVRRALGAVASRCATREVEATTCPMCGKKQTSAVEVPADKLCMTTQFLIEGTEPIEEDQ
jgi:hypothetical protein